MDNSEDYDDFPDMEELLEQANARQAAANKSQKDAVKQRGERMSPSPLSYETVRRRKS